MLKLKSSSIIAPPLVLIIVGLVVYVFVLKITNQPVQTLQVVPASGQASGAASLNDTSQLDSASPSASPATTATPAGY